MNINVIFNSSGDIVGTGWWQTEVVTQQDDQTSESEMSAGLAEIPGQTILEIEVPEELLRLDGVSLIKELYQLDAIKKSRANLITSGRGELLSHYISSEEGSDTRFSASSEGLSAGRVDI